MYSGSIVAIVTPMTETGEVDHAAWDRLLDWHVEQGTDAIVVCGTTGESPTVTLAEAQELTRRAVARLGGRLPVIAGSGTNDTAASIERTRALAAAGADAVLVVTPYYSKPTQEGLFQHFTAIADDSPVPVVLYNVPGRTGVDMQPSTVGRLARHPRIVAIKEAVAGAARVRELRAAGVDIVSLTQGEPDFNTPDAIIEAACRAMREGQTHYTPVDGTPALKEAVEAAPPVEPAVPEQVMEDAPAAGEDAVEAVQQ